MAGLVARYGNSTALGYPLTWCHTNPEIDKFEAIIKQEQEQKKEQGTRENT